MAMIACDIDSTLYDFESPAREAMFKLYKETGDIAYKEGAYHPWTEWRSPADVLGVNRWLKAIELVHDAHVIETMRPFDGAVATCQALLAEGHELLYISNRATESEAATNLWLAYWGFIGINDATRVVCTSGDKARYMSECQYIIDDRLKTVVQFAYDYDWEKKIRAEAERIRVHGPDEGTSYFDGHMEALDRALTCYYENDGEGRREALTGMYAVNEKAADDYYETHRRRAFVKAYPYNQAGTDVPGLYIAPTWAGLNEYLVSKGVLSEPATIPLGVLG